MGTPVNRQRDPPTGLGITALMPTPRAIIPGTEGKTGSRERATNGTEDSGQAGYKEMFPIVTQGVLGETDTGIE